MSSIPREAHLRGDDVKPELEVIEECYKLVKFRGISIDGHFTTFDSLLDIDLPEIDPVKRASVESDTRIGRVLLLIERVVHDAVLDVNHE